MTGKGVGMRLWLAVALFAGLGVMLLGCEREVDDRPVIGLVMKSLANEFFSTMEEGAWAHHADHEDAYRLRVTGMRDETDVAEQVGIVELMIAQGVDAIVIAPADSQALVGISQRAMDQGIIVVNIDNKLDEEVLADRGVHIPFVGPDNRKGARLAANYLAERLEAGDQVAIIEGAPNAYNGIRRRLGFEDAINEYGLDLVSSQTGYWETDQAMPIASAMINEHPNLRAILCANDSMALGAVAALRDAGRTDEVYVVGFDNISAVQRLLAEGQILCTVDQHAALLAVYGIQHALDMLAGDASPEDVETPVNLITADTL